MKNSWMTYVTDPFVSTRMSGHLTDTYVSSDLPYGLYLVRVSVDGKVNGIVLSESIRRERDTVSFSKKVEDAGWKLFQCEWSFWFVVPFFLLSLLLPSEL